MKIRLAFAVLTLPLLSGGCAAALLPLAAAGAMATQKTDTTSRPASAADVAVAAPDSSARPSGGNVELTAGEPVAAPIFESEPAAGTYEILDIAEMPAPSAAPNATALATNTYKAFTDYVIEQTAIDISEQERVSAILKDPSELNGEVLSCYGQPPAVLIDLDPIDDIFDPTASGSLDPGLRSALRTLATNSVEVLWISDLSPNFAKEVVTALKLAGVAVVDEDALLLGAGEASRKQVLRERAATRYCIVAIAGDEKGDFDEAYFYLRDPDIAVELDPLYGHGWFLAPTPFLPEG